MEGKEEKSIYINNPINSTTHRTIFNEIIKPLTGIWSQAQVLEAVKNHLVIFQPKVRTEHE